MQKLSQWGDQVGPKYVPEMEAFLNSDAARAAYDHKMNKVNKSMEMRHLMYDAAQLAMDFSEGTFDYGYGWNNDGSYYEWMDNRDLANAFEDLYQIKEDLKVLVNSEVAKKQEQLELAALQDPHMMKMFQFLQDDLNIHSCD